MTGANDRPLLQCRGIGKRFGGVTALAGVDFDLAAGEVHGLVGGNGAGKTTLMKILAGALGHDEGTILLNGRPVALASPRAALAHGIAMVYQELSGVGSLSAAENVFLGRQPTTRLGRLDWRAMHRGARRQLKEFDIDIDVARRLDSFPLAVRQMVEIARGIHSGATILILDEPTSSLSPPERRRLFCLIQQLRRRGRAIVFVSHFIEDVLEISDRVTILRDGRRVETAPKASLDKRQVIRRMLAVGLEGVEERYEGSRKFSPPSTAPVVLAARNLAVVGAFRGLDLQVSRGECLALYGFAGAGHEEAVHALAGALTPAAGTVLLEGRPLRPGCPHDAVKRGVVLVAADRMQGLFMGSEVYKNVTLAHLRRVAGEWVTSRREIAAAEPVLRKVGCRPADPRMLTGQLSGGNQQKVVIAKWMLGPLKVLLLDEPTRGMDVAAKDEVMRLVTKLKSQGLAVVLASVEPETVLAHGDRIMVMSRGRVTREIADTSADKAALMRYA